MRILIVEDHVDSRQAVERFFSRRGHIVTAVGDLKSGLKSLHEEPFDAIISDIALPDGTGYAMMSEARRDGINTLAIAVSAYGFPGDAFEGRVTGFDYHVQKPFDFEFLHSLITATKDNGTPPEPHC
jgi:DNA-binding response OmpR family regulator